MDENGRKISQPFSTSTFENKNESESSKAEHENETFEYENESESGKAEHELTEY